jgi:hypothetical protein
MEHSTEALEQRVQMLLDKISQLEANIAEQVTTQKLELVSYQGDTRGWVTTNEDGDVEIVMLDNVGKRRLRVFCSENSYSGIHIYGEEDENLARMEIVDGKIPSLVLTRPDYESEIRAEIGQDGTAEISVSEKETNKKVSMLLENGKYPCVVIRDGNDEILYRIPEKRP